MSFLRVDEISNRANNGVPRLRSTIPDVSPSEDANSPAGKKFVTLKTVKDFFGLTSASTLYNWAKDFIKSPSPGAALRNTLKFDFVDLGTVTHGSTVTLNTDTACSFAMTLNADAYLNIGFNPVFNSEVPHYGKIYTVCVFVESPDSDIFLSPGNGVALLTNGKITSAGTFKRFMTAAFTWTRFSSQNSMNIFLQVSEFTKVLDVT